MAWQSNTHKGGCPVQKYNIDVDNLSFVSLHYDNRAEMNNTLESFTTQPTGVSFLF